MKNVSAVGRRTAIRTAAGAVVLGTGIGVAADPVRGPLVVELFTSQGCSSCPPADRLLGELAQRADVVALSFHVTYWDRLGWKDPFASETTTARQHRYARSLAQTYVYTPEMVVNGVAHSPGTSASDVEQLLAKGTKSNPLRLSPVLSRTPDNGVTVELPALASASDDLDVWLVTYDRTHTTRVARGENRGASLVNRNVVRSIEKLAAWRGAATSWAIAGERIGPSDRSVAILVQRRELGPMLGAARLDRAPAG